MARLRRADRQRATTYAAVAALLLLGGCGGTPAAQPAPLEATPSQSTSPSPTAPAAPELPADAKGASNAAAVAFVEHYIDVLNYTAATLDTTALEELSADNCSGCLGIRNRIAKMRRAGGSVQGGQWTVVESIPQVESHEGGIPVQVVVDREKETAMESAGAEAVTYPAGRAVLILEVQQGPTSLRMRSIERVDQ